MPRSWTRWSRRSKPCPACCRPSGTPDRRIIDPLSRYAASPKGDDALAARRLLLGVSSLGRASS
ncbi:hypothetical protein F3J24_06975 [Comamonas sp. Tr-654]|nr:hypothetical protein [Comamonas sp. Tr-654]